MKIKMLKNFGGVLTNEKRIVEGVYDSEDPRLFGIAQYLVDNGHAIFVGGEVEFTIKEHVVSDPHDVTFHNKIMTKKGRPTITPVEKQSNDDDLMPRYRETYLELTGDVSDKRWGIKRIQEEILKAKEQKRDAGGRT